MNRTELSRQQLVAELARLKLRDLLEKDVLKHRIGLRRSTFAEEDNFVFMGDESYAQKR